MRSSRLRLVAAALAFGLLAPAAGAAPGGGASWWEEVWQVLHGWRVGAWLGLDKAGPDYDPHGTPAPPPPPGSLPGSPDKEGPDYDPHGAPAPPPPGATPGDP